MEKFIFVGILTICLLCNVTAQDKKRHKMALECIREVGIDPKIIQQAMETLTFPDNVQYKDFLACSYKKQGFQDINGTILIENIKEFLSTMYDITELNIINICGNVKGANDGEKAYNALTCIIPKIDTLEDINKLKDSKVSEDEQNLNSITNDEVDEEKQSNKVDIEEDINTNKID